MGLSVYVGACVSDRLAMNQDGLLMFFAIAKLTATAVCNCCVIRPQEVYI